MLHPFMPLANWRNLAFVSSHRDIVTSEFAKVDASLVFEEKGSRRYAIHQDVDSGSQM